MKTHVDIMSDFSYQRTVLGLKKLAEKHNFMIMEDRQGLYHRLYRFHLILGSFLTLGIHVNYSTGLQSILSLIGRILSHVMELLALEQLRLSQT